MDASTSLAKAKRQLEILKRELRVCNENQTHRQDDKVDYRSLVENAKEAIEAATGLTFAVNVVQEEEA